VSISTYTQFQAMEASEKEGLVILEASKRLMGWVVHSGSVYKLTGFDYPVFSPDSPIQDSGVALSSVGSVGAVIAGTYFHDRSAKILYLRTSDSVNPSAKFISMTFRMFFSMSGRNLPNDLSAGFDVHWLPLLKGTSDFGVEVDNQYQIGTAIEGTGKLQFFNDQSFWAPIYDKLYFENQRAFVYSWNPLLPVTEAKLIYRGRVQKKTYTPTQVSFDLQDVMNELRAPVTLPFLSSVVAARIPDNLAFAFQRTLYGYVNGHRPTNIDQELDGYPLTGTFSIDVDTQALTGSGTAFLSQLSPGDELVLGTDDASLSVTIDVISSNTAATTTEAYAGTSKVAAAAVVKPVRSKRYTNRVFLVAGHPLAEPTTTVTAVHNTSMIDVASTRDLRPGDAITVAGEDTTIVRVSTNTLKLSTSLAATPAIGATVQRAAISNVYLNDRKLTHGVEYTYSASTAKITLDPLAEFNVALPKKLHGTLSFTSGSRTVTGTGTQFTTEVSSGDWIKGNGEADYFEVLSVTDDATAVLRTASTYTASVAGIVKRPNYYTENSSILSCSTLGKTVDGTTTGALLKTAPQIVQDLLASAGLSTLINTASFTLAKSLTGKRLGLAIPSKFGDKTAPKLRDVIDAINKSDFGSLIQNKDFELEYQILSPDKPATVTHFAEADALAFAIQSDSNRIVKTSRVNYAFKEVDPIALQPVNSQEATTSDTAQYLAGATKEFSLDTLLIDQTDAKIYANRWAFLFEVASAVVKLGTKMQGARLQIGDKVELAHEKLYERVGSTSKRKIAAVSVAKKSVQDSSLELDDLSNAFSRCAVIASDTAAAYSSASEREKAITGYITDTYGMQGNDPDTFGVNIIW
jgi:hypothetical protein